MTEDRSRSRSPRKRILVVSLSVLFLCFSVGFFSGILKLPRPVFSNSYELKNRDGIPFPHWEEMPVPPLIIRGVRGAVIARIDLAQNIIVFHTRSWGPALAQGAMDYEPQWSLGGAVCFGWQNIRWTIQNSDRDFMAILLDTGEAFIQPLRPGQALTVSGAVERASQAGGDWIALLPLAPDSMATIRGRFERVLGGPSGASLLGQPPSQPSIPVDK